MSLAKKIISLASEKSVLLVTAESCTGGMIAAALTDIPGSSEVFDRGFVTYSNNAKSELLNIDLEMINLQGAVSEDVVLAMARGAVVLTRAAGHSIAVSVSGVAGPAGGSKQKPVGMVWFGLAQRHGDNITAMSKVKHFSGNRIEIRSLATEFALSMIYDAVSKI